MQEELDAGTLQLFHSEIHRGGKIQTQGRIKHIQNHPHWELGDLRKVYIPPCSREGLKNVIHECCVSKESSKMEAE